MCLHVISSKNFLETFFKFQIEMFSMSSPITHATIILSEFSEWDFEDCLFCFNAMVVV